MRPSRESLSGDADGSLADRLRALAAGVTRYDLVLAAAPLSLAAGAVLPATGLPGDGLGAGSLVALLAVAYGLFGDPPAGNGPGPGRAA